MVWTYILIMRIKFHYFLARVVPHSWSGMVENMCQDLMAIAPTVMPIPIRKSIKNMPWLGSARCYNIDCRHKWTVFAPYGIDPEIEMECPRCEQQAGILV